MLNAKRPDSSPQQQDLRCNLFPSQPHYPHRRAIAALALAAASLAMPLLAQQLPLPQVPAAGKDWLTPAGTVQGTRFSALAEINARNVSQLEEEFRFRTGIDAGHEGAPLVVGGMMYMVTPFPNKLIAFDLAKKGEVRWTFDPKPDLFAQDKACCDIVNRGAVYANGKIIYNVLDNTTVAVDAVTGKEVWRRKMGDPATGQTMTMAPLVVHNRVFVGNSGGELGVRGFIAALDVDSGAELWRAFSTGPDADVRIGAEFRPFYPKDRGANLGVTSWSETGQDNTLWQLGGSTVWAWITYDPELDLLFHGTANPGVWNPDMRPGDNKWSATTFARRPDSGMAVWAYQMTPHDAWDFDGVNESIVANLPSGTGTRQMLVRFDRNGFAYSMDRATGEVVNAAPFVHVNWASHIDLQTGKPVENPGKRPHEGINITDICPAAPGGKDQQPAAFSPRTSLFYVPANNLCMDYEALKARYIQGTPFVGASVKMKAGPGGFRGEFFAWDAMAGTKRWSIQERFPVWSGVLATAGDVVFYGTLDRWFKAVDANSGKVLFQTQLESGIVGHPMTFTGPDGQQRVAIYSGPGGWAGAIVPHEFATDDPFAALGAVGALADLPRFTPPGGAVHIFKLR